MIKELFYENILASQIGMENTFKTSLINMDKAKSLTINNQQGKSKIKNKRCQCGSLEHLHITSKKFPIGVDTTGFHRAGHAVEKMDAISQAPLLPMKIYLDK